MVSDAALAKLRRTARTPVWHAQLMSMYPYANRYPVLRQMPQEGRDRNEILAELREMATAEDATWQTGQASGSFYCGDMDHYAFMAEAFGMYGHMNALQRDVCPSATRFEGEIIAMGLDLFNAAAAARDGADPVGMITSGGSGSILHAVLSYRDHARQTRGVTRPNFVKPETGHPAFDKACHLLGVELRVAPIDPVSATVDVAAVNNLIDDQTIAILGSATNYGYGTIDPITELGQLALASGVGLHVDGCLGGFLLPFGEQLGFPIPIFDFRIPGVTSISADTHKYGYALKGTSLLLFRERALRNSQYFFQTGWTGGKYCSPGIDGSRSSGLLAATWAGMVATGREGYLRYAKDIFDTAYAMQAEVRSHPELRLIGDPSFLFSFTSDDFDVYHVNDSLRVNGWRMNGLQYPNAIHMAVTRPQTQPGVLQKWSIDLAGAVQHAKANADQPAKSSAAYGGVAGGLTDEADEIIRSVLTQMMDRHQSLPRG
jgi:sphinganine-1-phosphate aldolase